MEMLMAILALAIFATASLRWGYDSRELREGR